MQSQESKPAFYGWLYTTTLPGETDKIYNQMCLSFRRRQCFRGLKTHKYEPALQSGNLKKSWRKRKDNQYFGQHKKTEMGQIDP